MFKPYSFYQHRNCLDTDIEVIKVSYKGPNYTKLKVNFIDRKHTSYFQSNTLIVIKKEQYKNWKLV